MIQSGTRVHGRCLARQGNERLLQRLAAHECQLDTCGRIDNLRVRTRPILFDGAVQRVVGHANTIYRDGIPLGIPSIGVQTIAQNVSVCISCNSLRPSCAVAMAARSSTTGSMGWR